LKVILSGLHADARARRIEQAVVETLISSTRIRAPAVAFKQIWAGDEGGV